MRIQILGCQIFKTLQLTLESANLVTFTEEILIGKNFFFGALFVLFPPKIRLYSLFWERNQI